MLSQITDFADECNEFAESLDQARDQYGEKVFTLKTQFKDWTINDIVGHLHVWNWAANAALQNPAQSEEFLLLVSAAAKRGQMRRFERQWLKPLTGPALLSAWHGYIPTLCKHFTEADPTTRLNWVGPGMSARSGITARLMETWAHAQAVFDTLGMIRNNTDRIQNIVVLGVNTYSWAFKNRGLEPPTPIPYVALRTPSGTTLEFHNQSDTDIIKGSATEFCQVVTQVRNIKDTALDVRGDSAHQWMAIAQCFAGPPETPPQPGTRYRASPFVLC